jgi:CRISPR-associated endonuclease/helicase Cas3
MIPDYLWAKTTDTGSPGKSVQSHLNDVKAVASFLVGYKENMVRNIGLNPEQLAAFAGLHDIGKASPGFQAKCLAWLKKNGLTSNYGAGYETDHSVVTQWTIQNILQTSGMVTESTELWAAVLGAHHGRLHRPGIRLSPSDEDWQNKREEIASHILGNTKLPDFAIDYSWAYLWWIAGLVSVSDWIGSAEEWFPVAQNTSPEQSRQNALRALGAIGFDFPKIKNGLLFGDVFPFNQNDLQFKAEQNIRNPGLYIIEAPMGMGKTEAALWCAYQLMQKRLATGFYFALPTQATSNRIHIRVNNFLEKIVEGGLGARLIHSGSWLLDDFKIPILNPAEKDEKESNRYAIDWFASRKRGLLAPFGVGTIDQALMSIIAVKHFFVRQFALAGKVVILDEVHSYDLYTGTLIKTLCGRLLPLGCTIILLSATLTKEIKSRFIGTKAPEGKDIYPVISGKGMPPVKIDKPEPKTVKIQMKPEQEVLAEALGRAKRGACVLWVCDTVTKAQQMYDIAKENKRTNIEIAVLHSRFPVFRRQELEDYWMEKLGKEGKNRSGCILFSTQIVEQSVDLDADFMVTELAPTDMLLQRMGRLCRHERGIRKAEMWIVAESHSFDAFLSATAAEIKNMFGTKAMIYAPYVLLRSLQLWKDKTSIEIPGDIRKLLKMTYHPLPKEPESWKELLCETEGLADALRNFALNETNVWQLLTEDEEGKAKTRINNYETVQLILASRRSEKKRYLCNGDAFEISDDDTFFLPVAKAIYKNIVKVPSYCFSGIPDNSKNKTISTHVRGAWQIGYINENNRTIDCKYLHDTYKLKYTPEKGVEIIKTDKRNEANNEPCD